MKNRKAFTLIEVLAIIVVLAIIALIAVPNITGYVKTAQEGKFGASVEALIQAYKYKTIDEDVQLGRVLPCALDVEKCNLTGYLESCGIDKICLKVTDGRFCAAGTNADYIIKEGNCRYDGPEPPVPPYITGITVSNITVSSARVLVNFYDEGFIISHQYRLLDRSNNVIVDWIDGDSINNVNPDKTSSKIFSNLEKGTEYKVEVKIVNNNDENNTAISSKTFTTLNFNAPTITYDISKWETSKDVTITYPTQEGVDKKYRVLTTTGWDYSGLINAEQVQHVTVSNYQFFVEAKAAAGSSVLTKSAQIGFIDNENDGANLKPTIEALNFKNGSGINTNLISLRLKDDKSGIAYYCVTEENDLSNCNGNGNNTELNKWVLAVSNASDLAKVNKEVRDRTVQHQFGNKGKYYVFLKDAVGNVSDAKEVSIYKVEYDLNGGTGNVPYQIKLHGSDLILSDVTPTRSGYEFLGWDTNPNLNNDNPAYPRKGTYTNNSDVKLYAQWRKTVTITYNANSGSGTVASDTCYRYNAQPNCSIKFKNGGFTRTGYTFRGWAKGQNNVAVSYNANTNYNVAESETVYAGWEAKGLTFNDQTFTKNYDNADQLQEIVKATNGNNATTYTKKSETSGSTNTTRINVNSSNGTLTITGGTPKGQYKVVIEAKLPVSNTINGITEVTATKTMTVNVNQVTISNLDPDDPSNTTGTGISIGSVSDVTFKNSAYTPEPTVSVKTSANAQLKTLVKGTDFDYSYSNNTNVGTATITITLKGNYSGTKTKTFNINAYDISGATISDVTAVTYKGSAYTPEPTVTALGATLTKNTNFTYGYSNNINAGTATIIITGKGNYKGTKTKTFTINKKSLTVAWANTSLTYNRNAQKPTASVNTGISGKTLTINTDNAKTNAGTYSSSATCSDNTDSCSNYTLTSTSSNYTINPYNLSGATIADISAYTYGGDEKKPEPAVTALSTTLTKNTDFTYSYSNNTNAGTATVTVTGKGNYTGTKSKNFTINKQASTKTFTCATLTYTGSAQALITTATSNNPNVYYSFTTQLNSSNYSTAGTKINIAAGDRPKGTNGGTYKIYWYAPAGNQTEMSATSSCVISPKALTIPSSPSNKTYTGASQNSGVSCPTGSTNGGDTAKTDAGTYYHKCTLSSTTNYKWSDNTTAAKSIKWIINPKSIAVSWGTTTSFTYTGSGQAPTASASTGISGQTMTVNRTTGTNTGSYTSTASCGSVTNSACGNYTLTSTTKSFSITNANITATLTLTGTNKVGQTLTASITNASPTGTTNSYQWYRGSTAISGATASTYKVVDADVGQTIKVSVTLSKANYNAKALEDATDATNNGQAYSVPSTNYTVTVTGTNKVDQTLGVTISPSGKTPSSYQWIACNGSTCSNISGATGSTYTVPTGYVGYSIKAKVCFGSYCIEDATDATNNGSAAAQPKQSYTCAYGELVDHASYGKICVSGTSPAVTSYTPTYSTCVSYNTSCELVHGYGYSSNSTGNCGSGSTIWSDGTRTTISPTSCSSVKIGSYTTHEYNYATNTCTSVSSAPSIETKSVDAACCMQTESSVYPCSSYETSYGTTTYSCGSGWSVYSGSGSSLKCYKAAVLSN